MPRRCQGLDQEMGRGGENSAVREASHDVEQGNTVGTAPQV